MTKTATAQRGPGQEPSEAFNTPANPAPRKQSKEDVLEVTGQVWIPLGIRRSFCWAVLRTSSLILGSIYPKTLAGLELFLVCLMDMGGSQNPNHVFRKEHPQFPYKMISSFRDNWLVLMRGWVFFSLTRDRQAALSSVLSRHPARGLSQLKLVPSQSISLAHVNVQHTGADPTVMTQIQGQAA